MAGNGTTRSGHRPLPLACRISRWVLAAAIVAGCLSLYTYWIASGTQPICQTTTVTQTGTGPKATTTQACGLPGAAGYLIPAALVVLLLLPDAKAIAFGPVRWERTDDAPAVARVTADATAGDTPNASEEALYVLGSLLSLDDPA
jgi:hypothetical protein